MTSADKNIYTVREMKTFDFLVGGFFLILSIYTIFEYRSNYSSRQFSAFIKSLSIVLAPALAFTLKGLWNKTVITLNREGIYYYRSLLTDWKHFQRAYVEEQPEVGSIKDNFVLIIEFLASDDILYEQRVPLSSTYNQSGEEMVSAINDFSRFYQV